MRYNNPQVLKVFLEHDCHLSLRSNVSRSALHLAADFGLLEIFDLQCIGPEAERVFGWTADTFMRGRLDGTDPYAKYCSTDDTGVFQRLQRSCKCKVVPLGPGVDAAYWEWPRRLQGVALLITSLVL